MLEHQIRRLDSVSYHQEWDLGILTHAHAPAHTVVYRSLSQSHAHPCSNLLSLSNTHTHTHTRKHDQREREREREMANTWMMFIVKWGWGNSSNLGAGFCHHRKSIQQPEGEILPGDFLNGRELFPPSCIFY